MGAVATVREIGDLLGAGGTHTIGALVFWTLAGVSVPRAEFRKTFEDMGMGSAVPRDPRPQTCLTTAVTGAMVGKKDVIARRLPRGGGWGIVLESHDSNENKLEHGHIATVELEGVADVRTKWSARGKPAQLVRMASVKADIDVRYAQARSHLDTSDLSTILVNLMHGTTRETLLGAVSLRERTGGLYFVHSSRLEDLRLVKDAIERLAPSCQIVIMTITGSTDNLRAAAAAARQSFEAQLKELKEELAEFKSSLTEQDKDVSNRNIDVRAAKFDQLRSRVELFSDVLGDITKELTIQIATAKAELIRELETAT